MPERHESVELVDEATVRYLATAVAIAALTAALAQVSIQLPGSLPPFSLQPFGAFFAGLLLGPLWGGFAMAVYLLAGVAGAPVFSNGQAGLGYLLVGQGTGGFLVGFLVGAVVAGAIAHRRTSPRSLEDVSIPSQVLAVLGALVAIYAIGVPWLGAIAGLPLERAAAIMAPFVPLDALKAAIAIGIVQGGALARAQVGTPAG